MSAQSCAMKRLDKALRQIARWRDGLGGMRRCSTFDDRWCEAQPIMRPLLSIPNTPWGPLSSSGPQSAYTVLPGAYISGADGLMPRCGINEVVVGPKRIVSELV